MDKIRRYAIHPNRRKTMIGLDPGLGRPTHSTQENAMRTHRRRSIRNVQQKPQTRYGEQNTVKKSDKRSHRRQVIDALDLVWLNAQFPGGSWDSAETPRLRVDVVQELSPIPKERRGTMKRELWEQGLVYCLGFVFVCAALPFLRYMS